MMKQVLVLLTVLFSATFSYAQSGSVKGRLIDGENGEGVFGASVLVVGTTKGAISDFDGNFKVEGLSGDVTI